MRRTAALISAALLFITSFAQADAAPTVTRYDQLAVMTPTPTQPASISLRLRTMVRPADHLWVGPTIPSFVTPAIGHLDLDLLDARPGGGWIATYRQTFEDRGLGNAKNRSTLVKLFDASGQETWSLSLDGYLSRRDQLEVQDVRYAEDTGTLYFNEACQTYAADAGSRCSAMVALDPVARKVLWRTPSLTSNNELMLVGDYIITGYGFTAERCFVRVLRRRDGAVMDKHPLAGANFEMFKNGDHLQIYQPTNYGDANFTLSGFDGPTPKLLVLPNTPSTYVPKPYNPPLLATAHPPPPVLPRPPPTLPF
jgi:hypothetical protein